MNLRCQVKNVDKTVKTSRISKNKKNKKKPSKKTLSKTEVDLVNIGGSKPITKKSKSKDHTIALVKEES